MRAPGKLDWPALENVTSPEAVAMSKDLPRRGSSYVGSTTAYAFMEAVGLVNDHVSAAGRDGGLRPTAQARVESGGDRSHSSAERDSRRAWGVSAPQAVFKGHGIERLDSSPQRARAARRSRRLGRFGITWTTT